MARSIATATAIILLLSAGALAAGPDARAVIDKAIHAIGGEKRLAGLEGKAVQTTSKGTLYRNSKGEKFTAKTVVQGLDHFRRHDEAKIGGIPTTIDVSLAGDKAWRSFSIWNGNSWQPIQEPATQPPSDVLAEHRQLAYLHWVPAVILPLKGKSFTVESTKEAQVGGKPAVALTIIAPDKKKFELFFDTQSGLPVKMVAKIPGAYGGEYTQERTVLEYKSFDGIKWATKGETRRDGTKVTESEITQFQILDHVDPAMFVRPAGH